MRWAVNSPVLIVRLTGLGRSMQMLSNGRDIEHPRRGNDSVHDGCLRSRHSGVGVTPAALAVTTHGSGSGFDVACAEGAGRARRDSRACDPAARRNASLTMMAFCFMWNSQVVSVVHRFGWGRGGCSANSAATNVSSCSLAPVAAFDRPHQKAVSTSACEVAAGVWQRPDRRGCRRDGSEVPLPGSCGAATNRRRWPGLMLGTH